MVILNHVLIIVGLGAALYFGYAGFDWYYIFITGFLFTLGWAVLRVGAIISIKEGDGVFGLIKLLTIQVLLMSIIGSVLFALGNLFS